MRKEWTQELDPAILSAVLAHASGLKAGQVIMCCPCCTIPGKVKTLNFADGASVTNRETGKETEIALLVQCDECNETNLMEGCYTITVDKVIERYQPNWSGRRTLN